MAVKAVTPQKLTDFNELGDAVAFNAATTAADGFTVDYTGKSARILILFKNTNASTTARSATIKAGNGIQGVTDLATGDIAAGKIVPICIESGAFKNVSGTNKGKVLIIPSHAELEIAVVELP